MTNTKEEVLNRLADLYAIKNEYSLQTNAPIWRNKANMVEEYPAGENDFRTSISAIVKMQKDAELYSAIPEFLFKPLDSEGRKNRPIVERVWAYHWLHTMSDLVVSEAIESSTTFGTGIVYEGIKHEYKNVQTPIMKEGGEIEFMPVRKFIGSSIESRKIPFENFFINGTSIDNATEAIVITYYDRDAYCNGRILDPSYKNIDKVKTSQGEKAPVPGTVGDKFSTVTMERTVTEIEYYNEATDQYIVLANGIVVKESPIPFTHKKLPFSLYVGEKGEGRIFGMGVFELLAPEERYKNELRTLLVQGVKFSIGLILVDRNADLEEDNMVTGLGQTYTTDDLNAMKQYSFNVPIGEISEAERKIDDDIVAKSGVDFKSQLLGPNETATKTQSKQLSSRKRINKNIKDNSYQFFRRLAFLRMANIQFLHSLGSKEVPIDGGSINGEGIFEKEGSGATGSVITTPELMSGQFMVIPIAETMLGDNKARRIEDAKEYASLVSRISGSDGAPIIKGTPLAKLLTEEFGYDFSELTEATSTIKDPEEMLKQFKMQMNGTRGTEADPTFVGINQRSGKGGVPTLSGRANSPLPTE